MPHIRQRTRNQRGDAANLFRPATICREVHRGAGTVAARRRRQDPRLPGDAGQSGSTILRGIVRPRLRLADEPGGGKRTDRRSQALKSRIRLRKLQLQFTIDEIRVANEGSNETRASLSKASRKGRDTTIVRRIKNGSTEPYSLSRWFNRNRSIAPTRGEAWTTTKHDCEN